MPVQPRPKLVPVSHRVFRKLTGTVQPCPSTIQRDLDSLNLMIAAVVGISLDAVRTVFCQSRQQHFLALRRLDYDSLDFTRHRPYLDA